MTHKRAVAAKRDRVCQVVRRQSCAGFLRAHHFTKISAKGAPSSGFERALVRAPGHAASDQRERYALQSNRRSWQERDRHDADEPHRRADRQGNPKQNPRDTHAVPDSPRHLRVTDKESRPCDFVVEAFVNAGEGGLESAA
jgi:hypothetical protein